MQDSMVTIALTRRGYKVTKSLGEVREITVRT